MGKNLRTTILIDHAGQVDAEEQPKCASAAKSHGNVPAVAHVV